MKIEETKFYEFAKKFCEENEKEFDGTRFSFFHNNDIPFGTLFNNEIGDQLRQLIKEKIRSKEE